MVDADDAGTDPKSTTTARAAPRPGPHDALTDVRGLRVGHAQRRGSGWLSGTTVVLAPRGGVVAAVDVRGGGPGTRETDALDPRNLVQQVEAVVLTGGSAFGLDAASGVVAWLEERGRGFRVGPEPAQVVPVVPAAALFDLGRGGDWRSRPDAGLGREAVAAAHDGGPVGPTRGNVGAGTGAVAGGLKGGIGTASVVLPSGITVAALVAVNAAGSPVDPTTGRLYGTLFAQHPPYDEERQPTDTRHTDDHRPGGQRTGGQRRDGPRPGDHRAGDQRGSGGPAPADATVSRERHLEAQRRLQEARNESARRSAASVHPPLNTTLAVVATDAALSRAQAQKLAGTAHDGLARAVRPVHLLSDGDTVFALATGDRPLVNDPATDTETAQAATSRDTAVDPAFGVHLRAGALNEILAAGADVLTRAVVDAMLAAESIDGPGGVFPSYRDLYAAQGP
ncbi:P1 family peptidase [Streptomyces sp. NPDC057702]|uniref:P1 family peptidase n=1 Tax=unclassified Streptomyces TaxID=2593676 RepID=UPI003697F766